MQSRTSHLAACLLAGFVLTRVVSSAPADKLAQVGSRSATGGALTNFAADRPCEPNPRCSALLGGPGSTAVSLTAAAPPRVLLEPLRRIKVFLEYRVPVVTVVVFCADAGAPAPAGSGSTHEPSGDVRRTSSAVAAAPATPSLKITAWDGGQAESLIVPPAAHGDGEHPRRLEFALGGRAVTSVALDWSEDSGSSWLRGSVGALGTRSLCGPSRRVARVELLGHPASAAPASRRTSAVSAVSVGAGDFLAGPSLRPSGGLLIQSDAELNAIAAPTLQSSFVSTPQVVAASFGSTLLGGFGLVSGMSLTLLGFAVAFAIVLPTFLVAKRTKAVIAPLDSVRIGSQTPCLQGHAETGTHFFWIGDLPPAQSSTTVQSFWIGDPEDTPSDPADVLEEQSPVADAGSAVTSSVTLPETESEPEAELYPESGLDSDDACTNEAVRGRSATVDGTVGQLRGVEFKSAVDCTLPEVSISADIVTGATGQKGRVGQLVMLHASPLCSVTASGLPTQLPAVPYEQEWRLLLHAHEEAAAIDIQQRRQMVRRPELAAFPLTSSTLQRAVTPSATLQGKEHIDILHISAHGSGDSLVLDNGKGTAHFLQWDLLRAMLGLHASGRPRLVVLNVCKSDIGGSIFAECGVPHVICTTADIVDTWSHAFLRVLYATLFQGYSVAAAFEAASVALRCDPVVPTEAADIFCLLPKDDAHEEVLFPCAPSNVDALSHSFARCRGSREEKQRSRGLDRSVRTSSTPQSRGRTRRQVASSARSSSEAHASPMLQPLSTLTPRLPEDYLGRSVDVWSVLQLLSGRRVVVVCDGSQSSGGVGKSTVLDAVHKFSSAQMGKLCVTVRLAAEDAGAEASACWVAATREAARRVLRDLLTVGSAGSSGGGARTPGAAKSARRCSTAADWLATARPRSGSHACSPAERLALELSSLLAAWREARRRRGSGCLGHAGSCGPGGDELLLILDGGDAWLQRRDFQDDIAALLQRLPECRLLLSARQRMEGSAGGHFKVVHHALGGLAPAAAARLFLRRVQRPLRPDELPELPPSERCEGEQATFLRRVAAHPAVAACAGNPRELIQLGSQVGPLLRSLGELSSPTHSP